MKILAIESSCDETAAAVIEVDRLPMSVVRSENRKRKTENVSILSNIVSSQIDIHKQFGGVFPEIASRAHTEQIIPVVEQALSYKAISYKEKPYNLTSLQLMSGIDLVAVTAGPGLIGSLLVGVNAAKTLAFANNIPIIGINHWLGHIYSCFAQGESYPLSDVRCPTENGKRLPAGEAGKTENSPQFPLLALIVSGGHTGLVYMKSHTDYETIGQTLDDAAGEAFDKVAKLLQLPYPGGPAISESAAEYKNKCHSGKKGLLIRNLDPRCRMPSDSRMTISFPRSMLGRDDFNFSFSGLKTSVLYKVKELEKSYPLDNFRDQVAFEFQQAVIDILIGKTLKAAEKYHPRSIILCGGVSANKELREQMESAVLSFRTGSPKAKQDPESRSPMPASQAGGSDAIRLEDDTIKFHVPPMELTGDNAAMIGIAAAYQIANGIKPTAYSQINANANLKLS